MRKSLVAVILSVFTLLILAACGTTPAAAPTPTLSPVSDIVIVDAWARAAILGDDAAMPAATSEGEAMPLGETNAGAMGMNDAVSAVYMVIENRGGAADRLVGATTDAASIVELHQTQIDDQGVAHMTPITAGLEIPAGGSVRLEPGNYHIMLMGLTGDLTAGQMVTLTLQFASGQEINVEAEIRES